MTRKNGMEGRRQRIRIKGLSAGDDVGYGRPPRHHQFRPSQSGNPKGRPKGAKSEATILNELPYRKIPVHQGGKTRKITVLEAILLRFTEDSLKGNTKSAAFLLNRHGVLTSGEPPQSEISDDDQNILETFAQRVLEERSSKRVG